MAREPPGEGWNTLQLRNFLKRKRKRDYEKDVNTDG